MAISKTSKIKGKKIKEGLNRSLVHLDNLMVAILDFDNGPWTEHEPFHSHVHEQISYIAEGEILFFCENEEKQRLKKGDLFYVPSGKKHGIQLISDKARLIDSFSPIRGNFLERNS